MDRQGEVSTIREAIIPHGACVEEERERFARIDAGQLTETELAVAKAACATCSQVRICKTYAVEVGTQLFQRGGNRRTVAGGEEVGAVDGPRANVVDEPIPFDLSVLPRNPERALSFLRIAVRSERLLPGTVHVPPNVKLVAERFIASLQHGTKREKGLFGGLQNPPRMTGDRARHGVESMVSVLFQQADYPKVIAHKKNKARYNLDRVDQAWDSVLALYAEEMLTLDARGFRDPPAQARAFSVAEYEKIAARYLGPDINPTDFHYILHHNLFDPERAFRERDLRIKVLREQYAGTDVQDSMIRERGRWRGDLTREVKPKAAPQRPTVAELNEAQPDAEEGPAAVMRALGERFGDRPGFTAAAAMRLAHLPVEEAIRRYAASEERFAKLRQDPSLSEVAEGFLRHRVRHMSPNVTAGEALQKYRTNLLVARFSQRAAGQELEFTTPTWAFERAVVLYPEMSDLEKAAESLYWLYDRYGILTESLAESDLLQRIGFRSSVGTICDPKNGRYVAFHPAIQRAEDRLALAAHYGLSRLLYGIDLNADEVAQALGVENLEDYVLQTVLPNCRQMVVDGAPAGMLPALLSTLSDDLDLLHDRLVTQRSEVHPENREDMATVIGGLVHQLGPHSIELSIEDDGLRRWLQRAIFERCQPYHLQTAPAVEQALQLGAIEITGSTPETYQVSWGAAIRGQGDEQEFAALANMLGIDFFMYGCNMREILEARLDPGLGVADTAANLLSLLRSNAIPQQKKEVQKRQFFEDLPPEANDWLLRSLLERNSDRQSVGVKASALKAALQSGMVYIEGDADSGFALQFADSAEALDIVQLVDGTGVFELLTAASQSSLQVSRPLAMREKSEMAAISQRFAAAMEYIIQRFVHDLTPSQKNQMHDLVWNHFDNAGQPPAFEYAWQEPAFRRTMTNLGELFADFTHRLRPDQRESYEDGHRIAQEVFGNLRQDSAPRPLAAVMHGLAAQHPRAALRHMRNEYRQLVKLFVDHVARNYPEA